MKRLLRTFEWLVILSAVVIGVSIVYATAQGYLTWYFRVNGVVKIDGIETGGYLHADTRHTVLLVTRTDEGRPETYLVPVQGSQRILGCGDWHPIRFLPTPVRDVNQPCVSTDQLRVRDAPKDRTLVTSRRSVEFITVSGRKIKAEW